MREGKPKAVIVTPFYSPAELAGSGRLAQGIVEGLREQGWDCTVLTGNGRTTRAWYLPFWQRIKSRSERYRGVRVVRLKSAWWRSLMFLMGGRLGQGWVPKEWLAKWEFEACGPHLLGLRESLNKIKPEVVWVLPFPAYLNWQVAKILEDGEESFRLVVTPCFHQILTGYYQPELKRVLELAEGIHVLTKAEKKVLEMSFKIDSQKIWVVSGFIEPREASKKRELAKVVQSFKKRRGLEEKKLIISVGNKIEQKGVKYLLEAIRQLYQKDKAYRLLMVGRGYKYWRQLVEKQGGEFLVDMGYLSEKEKEVALAASEVFCLVSTVESFGLVYLEAWRQKKPVIGAMTPPVTELIGEAKGGMLVKFGQVKTLQTAITCLIEHPELAKKMGESGFRALQKHHRARIIKQLARLARGRK